MLFSYTLVPGPLGQVGMPLLPIRLENGTFHVDEIGLIDSGSTVNVLPYDLGLQLGLDWDSISLSIPVGGNLASQPAKAISLLARVGSYPPVRLGFAWIRSNSSRLLLGQVNFFSEFDVSFFGSRNRFEVAPKP